MFSVSDPSGLQSIHGLQAGGTNLSVILTRKVWCFPSFAGTWRRASIIRISQSRGRKNVSHLSSAQHFITIYASYINVCDLKRIRKEYVRSKMISKPLSRTALNWKTPVPWGPETGKVHETECLLWVTASDALYQGPLTIGSPMAFTTASFVLAFSRALL